MINSESETDDPLSYFERYSTFSDNQIKEILKNHKNYQESAVMAAVKIAVERELIHSEQDLLSPEYQYQPASGLKIFPLITDKFQYKKVVSSIFRVLFILSLLPVLFGFLKSPEGQSNITYTGVGLGLVWAALTYLLLKTNNVIVLISQIVILLLVFIGASYLIFILNSFQVIDFIVLIVATLLPVYFLLYLRKLNQTKPE